MYRQYGFGPVIFENARLLLLPEGGKSLFFIQTERTMKKWSFWKYSMKTY